MASRKLRSHTIIPADLYLRRQADDQLREIILEMGRPGYVLVARQMGKTNLLLNARRELPESGDLFVYVDVSNVFPELRSFFRNLIDVALESLLPNGVFLQEVVQQTRIETSTLPPHKEHEMELRRLLQSVSGKVVVFLDEVDALTKTGYSDQVFSFIRSVYFAGRANFEEFTRLTYVLSGVAEPGELIQNKAVSPFNIGEKIYLDDFSRREFGEFLKHAELDYSEAVSDRIFYWTAGHPRMTWDVCAALERRSRSSLALDDVDAVVDELYFGSVNVPPIDHIKDLVAQSKGLRDSVMTIHYQKTDALTDSARTRLYLAGISRFDIQQRVANFKNRVIERALSEDFIRSIDVLDTVQIDAGIKLFQSEHFGDALALFNSIARGTNDARLKNTAVHWAGLTQFQLGKFSDALASLESINEVEKEFIHWYYRGLAHLNLAHVEEAIDSFRKALRTQQTDEIYYYDALANLGAALCRMDPPPQTALDEASKISTELIEKAEKLFELSTISGKSVLVSAYRNLFRVAELQEDPESSMRYLALAKQYADDTELLKLMMTEISLADMASRPALLENAVSAVMSIKVFSLSTLQNKFALDEIGRLLEQLDDSKRRDDAVRVLGHVLDHVGPSEELLEVIENLVFSKFTRGYQELGAVLLEEMLEREHLKRNPVAYRSLLTYAMLIDEGLALKYGPVLVESYEKNQSAINGDFGTALRALHSVFSAAIRNSNLDLAGDAARAAGNVISGAEMSASLANSAALLHDYMTGLVSVVRFGDSKAAATVGALIRKLTLVRQFELPLFPKDFQRNMQRDLAFAIRAVPVATVVNNGQKYGRNALVVVSYNGDERSGKYKKFLEDINAGRCVVLRVLD